MADIEKAELQEQLLADIAAFAKAEPTEESAEQPAGNE